MSLEHPSPVAATLQLKTVVVIIISAVNGCIADDDGANLDSPA